MVSALVRDKALLNEMFLRCGAKEFRYIKVLGGQIGFMFGVLQMIVWYEYHDINSMNLRSSCSHPRC